MPRKKQPDGGALGAWLRDRVQRGDFNNAEAAKEAARDPEVMRTAIKNAIDRGDLFPARISYRNVRYFPTKEQARAAEGGGLRVNPRRSHGPVKPAGWNDAQPHFPTHPDGSPAWRLTVCPSIWGAQPTTHAEAAERARRAP